MAIMNTTFRQYALLGNAFLLIFTLGAQAESPRVEVLRTPDRGIQPQAVADENGVVHLIYFKGEPGNGDLFYVRREAGEKSFSAPKMVNSQRGSVVATGSIRGAQIALGRSGRIHVAWNGSGKAASKNAAGGQPMLFTRLNDAGTAFEPERNVMMASNILDGGGTVAADRDGHVFVSWHAIKANGPRGEENRQVWLARSDDDGKTFAVEVVANDQPTGACGCCGMRAFADSKGTAYLLYRAATNKVNRDMILLWSNDAGKDFKSTLLHKMNTEICPMSSEAFAEGPGAVYCAWETENQVFFSSINPPGLPVKAPAIGKDCKHPALAVNRDGEILLAWAEGTGWQRGGDLAWQVFDKSGRPTSERGRIAGGIPVWGLPTAVAGKDGRFTIVH